MALLSSFMSDVKPEPIALWLAADNPVRLYRIALIDHDVYGLRGLLNSMRVQLNAISLRITHFTLFANKTI